MKRIVINYIQDKTPAPEPLGLRRGFMYTFLYVWRLSGAFFVAGASLSVVGIVAGVPVVMAAVAAGFSFGEGGRMSALGA